MSLIKGDSDKLEKLFNKLSRFGSFLGLIGYIAGIVYFFLLPHEQIVHRTYMSENALSPGLVKSDLDGNSIVNDYYKLIKTNYENNSNHFDADLVYELFSQVLRMEVYVQNFNLSDPFHSYKDHLERGKNVYAFGRSQRGDGTESIVVSAPLYVNKKSKSNSLQQEQEFNLIGISNLFVIAHLAKNRPYWAKDLIFLVTDVDYFGTQAWLNAYFDTKSEFIQAENLNRRGGAIQAAINLEIPDYQIDNILLKLEGSNGKLPNLDLVNAAIRLCSNLKIKCSLASEKFARRVNYYSQMRQEFIIHDYVADLKNMISMVGMQATGVPSASHGYFLDYRIEAITLRGTSKTSSKSSTAKNINKKLLFDVSRIIEGTLRCVNNLLERFHQSFFFYLLPTSANYISIAMYMPAFGLILLPVIIKIIILWLSLFRGKSNYQVDNLETSTVLVGLLSGVMSNLLVSFGFGIILHFGTSYFIQFGNRFDFDEKDSLINCVGAILINILFVPFILGSRANENASLNTNENLYLKDMSQIIIKLVDLFLLTLLLGSLSLLNFSFAFVTAVFFVPASLLACISCSNKFLKFIQRLVLVICCPLIIYLALFILYEYVYENQNLFSNPVGIFSLIKTKYYTMAQMAKISRVWTYDIVNLCLIPLWMSLWLTLYTK